VLFDGQMLILEHAVLSDTLFIFLVVAAVTVLLWSPPLSARAAAGAGALLALAALTRTIALPLIALVVVALAMRRVGRRPLLAAAIAAGLPIALYAGWYASVYGRFTLAGGDGVALWARTMTFADCRVIRPPADEARLCPNGSHQDAASEYVWATDSAINQIPGTFANNDLARAFAVRAITAQPLDYLGSVVHDVSLAFRWTPAPHPLRVAGAYSFGEGRWPLATGRPEARATLRAYDPGADDQYSVAPYAGFLVSYQRFTHLRGPVLAAILLAGLLGVRRRTLLPWSVAVALLLLPVLVLDFDHRYVLPVVPLACVAAALGIADLRIPARIRDRYSVKDDLVPAVPDREPSRKTADVR
jgi:hypothetical protein